MPVVRGDAQSRGCWKKSEMRDIHGVDFDASFLHLLERANNALRPFRHRNREGSIRVPFPPPAFISQRSPAASGGPENPRIRAPSGEKLLTNDPSFSPIFLSLRPFSPKLLTAPI
jgi:hypothetical protein